MNSYAVDDGRYLGLDVHRIRNSDASLLFVLSGSIRY